MQRSISFGPARFREILRTRFHGAHRAALALTLLATASAHSPGQAAEIGEDGLHQQDWFLVTFRDVAEDVASAAESGRGLLLLVEQKGCPYCAKLHATLLDDPEVRDAIVERFDVVQYNLLGSDEVIDVDGELLTEASAAERWGVRFTPTMMLLDARSLQSAASERRGSDAMSARDAAVAVAPGVPSREELLALVERVATRDGDEPDN